MTNEEVVRQYSEAIQAFDDATLRRLRHKDWCAVWPQSGELVRGSNNSEQIMAHYPGGPPQLLPEGRLTGSEDRWVVSPLGGPYRVAGEGEQWFGEWKMRYPDGRVWFTVLLLEVRDGKILRETQYWSEPFDPPSWRAEWVEKL